MKLEKRKPKSLSTWLTNNSLTQFLWTYKTNRTPLRLPTSQIDSLVEVMRYFLSVLFSITVVNPISFLGILTQLSFSLSLTHTHTLSHTTNVNDNENEKVSMERTYDLMRMSDLFVGLDTLSKVNCFGTLAKTFPLKNNWLSLTLTPPWTMKVDPHFSNKNIFFSAIVCVVRTRSKLFQI
jgi:hypothetical protein